VDCGTEDNKEVLWSIFVALEANSRRVTDRVPKQLRRLEVEKTTKASVSVYITLGDIPTGSLLIFCLFCFIKT
jgi:exosome complex RNA-binding protein Rrp42 (RNase PH superfamily)